MEITTLTYSATDKGWTSRWSYIPDWMLGLNNNFYTWNEGSLYKHWVNETHNEFYGTVYPTEITTIFNEDYANVDVFNALAIYGTDAWDVEVTTDINDGQISADFFKNKEGRWYSYIRRNEDDFDARSLSVQGLGQLLSIATNTLTFAFKIDSIIAVGDLLLFDDGTDLFEIGTIVSHTPTTVTVDAVANVPAIGDFVLFSKDPVAESYGCRGYYMEVKLTLPLEQSITLSEIFSVSTTVFKSYY
jgi:hypothetical protein